MLDESVFGEVDKSGRILRDVSKCASTGMKVGSGDAFMPIGNNHFYRLKAPLFRMKDVREEIEDLYREQVGLEPETIQGHG